jgi:hypothetical protein
MATTMALVKVFTSNDSMQAHFVCSLLEQEGIAATVLGDKLALALGGVPMTSGTLPGVWVAEEAHDRAVEVVQRVRKGGVREQLANVASWTCPKCGEVIEPQFTECWSCGTSQPAATDQPEPVPEPPISSNIELNVPCLRCTYNLRGLPPSGRCPECGLAVARSLLTFVRGASAADFRDLNRFIGGIITEAAERTGCPPSIVLPLLDAWFSVMAMIPPALGVPPEEDAAALCASVARILCDGFDTSEAAAKALGEWKLITCRDLGRTLFAFIDQGLLEPRNRVTLNSFPQAPIQVRLGR